MAVKTGTNAPVQWICSGCVTKVENPKRSTRAPRGWKRKGEEYFCGNCWRERYLLRAITMPVVSPLDCTWEELRADLKTMWRDTTQCSNWMMTACFAGDVRREPGMEKMPAMPRLYLYPEARKLFPALPSQTVSSLEHAIQNKYRKLRYDIVWTCAISLPSVRYPAPFPVHNQSWEAKYENEAPVISVRFGPTRRRLRLKGGAQMWRQRAAFDQIVRGTAQPGELMLYQRGSKLLAKLVAWLPRQDRRDGLSGTLAIRTAPDCLLVALRLKEESETLWRYNADHIRQRIAEHRKLLQRFAEDTKYEHRPHPPLHARREEAVQKFADRMSSYCHQIAAALAGVAQRGKYAAVCYDDREHGYCPEFPWARLRSLIIEKLNEIGVPVGAAPLFDNREVE